MSKQLTCDRCGKPYSITLKDVIISGFPVGAAAIAVYGHDTAWFKQEFDLCSNCLQELAVFLGLNDKESEDHND